MIVQTCVDESGGVSVSVDSDGDQGDGYAPEVLSDMLARASASAIELWNAARAERVEGVESP